MCFVRVISLIPQWKITVPVGERIHLTFNSLELVPSACGDYVQVYGGHRPGSTSLGKHHIYTLIAVD